MSNGKRCVRSGGKTTYPDERRAKQALTSIRKRVEETGRGEEYVPTSAYRCTYCHKWHLTSSVSVGVPYDPPPSEPASERTPLEQSEEDRLLLEGIVRRCIATNCGACMHDKDWGLYRIRRGLIAPHKSNTQPTNHEGDAT
ncbi:MAG: hypothetical protein KGH75_00220 [Rhodospirillales bacterium]|nr:hypothetical protein [Rhodospirillales bacterium]